MPNQKPIGVAYEDQQLDGCVVGKSGGSVGFFGASPSAKPAACTASLTVVTCSAPSTPDYAIADLTQTTPYGFASKDEGQTVLKVIANLQTRQNEIEAKLQALGLFS